MKQTFKAFFEKKAVLYAEEHSLIEKNSRMTVALSGGSDSVCLLKMLCAIREKYNIYIVACHVNHMIRDEEADRDEEFCRQLCKRLNVEFVCGRFDVPKAAKEQKKSLELAARDIRYGFLREVCKKYNTKYLATAHNRNDNAETMTVNFIRGSGLGGLCGIDVCRNDGTISIIRPILCMDKEEILAYLRECGESYVTDSTNFEADCTRNKIRLELIEYIKANLNPNFCKTVTQNAVGLECDNDFIEKEVLKHTKECIFNDGEKIFIKKSSLEKLHKSMRYRIIRKAVQNTRGTIADIGIDAVGKIDALQKGSVNLSGGLRAYISYDRIYFEFAEKRENAKAFEYDFSVGDVLDLRECGGVIKSRILSELPSKRNKNNVYFDYDEVKNRKIIFRSRRNGDAMHTESGRKKIKDLFIDLKIPVSSRNKIPIMECDGEILWVCAVRRSDKYKINEDTKKVLQITYIGEDIQ